MHSSHAGPDSPTCADGLPLSLRFAAGHG
jgi:hypothetical protein